MSQHMLPHTVRIKRKRQDEPVETLHVHTHDDPKKRRFTLDQPSIFRRVPDDHDAPTSVLSPTPEAASTSVRPAATAAGNPSTLATARSSTTPASSSRPSSSCSSERKILAPAPVTRRFHLSAKSVPDQSRPFSGVQKRKNVATLVEAKPKKTRTDGRASGVAQHVAQKAPGHGDDDYEMQIDEPLNERPLKRPGRTARSVSPAVASISQAGRNGIGTAAKPYPTGSEAITDSKDGVADRKSAAAVDPGLLSEMQKFAQEVEHAEQKSPTAAAKAAHKPSTMTPQKLKFQPKAVPRFRDRHPERFTNETTTTMDVDDDSDSDGDYVYDTYVRYDGPADTLIEIDPLTATSLPPDIGVLVISAEDRPLWEAYMEPGTGDADSDKEFDTDDEDENAEDFYANEYPEDEVASDDERDEGAYAYRVGASDEEEYGLYSDEEDLSRPWGRRPAWLRESSGEDSDED